MANKVWVVHWGSGTIDDDGNVSSYCGVHSVHTSKESAKKSLTLCKDNLVEDIKNPYIEDAESEEELQEQLNDLELEVYGSENEEYFEIDYTSWDVRNEIYVGISEQELK
jgi:PDZ domain-containing secreted protein